jgi:hypothetical protein
MYLQTEDDHTDVVDPEGPGPPKLKLARATKGLGGSVTFADHRFHVAPGPSHIDV